MELFNFMSDMTKAQRDVIVLEAQCSLESGDCACREDNACLCNGDHLRSPLLQDSARSAIRIYQCQDKKSRRGDETVISASPKSMRLSVWMNPRKSPCIHPGMGKHRLSLSQAPWNICSVCLIKPEMRFLPRSRATPRQSSCRANAGLGENDQWFNFLRKTGSRSTMLYKRS